MKNKFLLRVVSGKYRGKGIVSPENMSVRPTSQRVKESLFNIIRMELYNAKFLDMFSGTGQVGIEAISNGATSTFIDLNTALLKKNIEQIGCQDFSRVFSGDFKRVMSDLNDKGEKFDFIFADPPYNDGLYSDIIRFSMPLLSEDGKIILEHSSDCEITAPDDAIIFDKRAYGSRSLTFLGGKNEKNGVSGEL